jgi:hypothetical protein
MAAKGPTQQYGLGEARVQARALGLDVTSGGLSAPLLTLPAGARVASAAASLSGRTFRGRVGDLAGARVTESSVTYDSDGTAGAAVGGATRAFVVDFGRPVSVRDLQVSPGSITFVLPWLGTDFNPVAAYPAGKKKPGTATGHAALTGLETQKLLVQLSGASSYTEANFAERCTITTGTVPANLRASVNGRPVFWTHPGSLSGSVAITGLAAELNALTGPVVLTVATDAPGVLELDFDPPVVDQRAEARWGGATTTDVRVPALADVDVVVPLVGPDGPWIVTALELDVRGSFPPWRAYPAQATAEPGPLGLRIDATFSAARRIAGELYGVALPLRVNGPAELHVALVAEDAGVPGSTKPLASAVLTPATGTGWHEALFAAPVSAESAWLVVQAKTGAVEWAAVAEAAAPSTRTLGAAGSARWSAFPPVPGGVVVAQARVLRAPLATENAPLLTLGWDEDSVALDPPGPVVLSGAVATDDHTLTLRVRSQSSGVLTLGPATAVY